MTEHHFSLQRMQAAIRRVMDGGHSVFSPSGSKMWLTCAGSLIPNMFAPDDAGVDAAYGTVGHMVGETWLRSGHKPVHLIGTQEIVYSGDFGYLIDIDKEMVNYVQEYVDWCWSLPGEHFVETKVYFSRLTPIPDQGGTADHVACMPGRMVITDLKMGKGVRVDAEGNTQALLYALGFFYEYDWYYDFQEIEIRISQPRLGVKDVWIVSRDFLMEFAGEVRVKAAAAWKHDAPRTASVEGCRWCKVKVNCAERARFMMDMYSGAFDDLFELKDALDANEKIDKLDVHDLTTAQLSALYQNKGMVTGYWDDVNKELMRRLNRGEDLPYQKLVNGKSSRSFANPKKAAEKLIELGCKKDEVIITQYPSPAGAETLLRKVGLKGDELEEAMGELNVKVRAGAPTLAAITDKRERLKDETGEAFADLFEM